VGGHDALTVETLVREVRLFFEALLENERGGLTRAGAEVALGGQMTTPLDEHLGFLLANGFVAEAEDGKLTLLGRGRAASKGSHDATLYSALTSHFADRLASGELPRRPGAPEDAPLTLFDGRYERGDEIGQGTLGTVYRARAHGSSREVAIKEIRHVFQFVSYLSRGELMARVRGAVETQAQNEHPHIASVLDVGLDLPFPLIVTELCAGGSLRARLEDARAAGRTGVQMPLALSAAQQCLVALRALHTAGVSHGGVRPENVLFDGRGNVRLTDVGMSAVTERTRLESTAPVYVGSAAPSYSPPEVLKGGGASPQADLYSFGVLLYELLTGELPGRRSPMPSELNPMVHPALDEAFERLTRDAPGERYPDVDAVLAALEPALPPERQTPGLLWLWEEDPFPPEPAPLPAGLTTEGEAQEFDDDPVDVTQPAAQAALPADGAD
jgi:serine/threonine protein kinase